jgi:hypothetical protein
LQVELAQRPEEEQAGFRPAAERLRELVAESCGRRLADRVVLRGRRELLLVPRRERPNPSACPVALLGELFAV